ncbi:hypothetical protein BC834DRAFT_842325 [Gloeopeniophorella convolvens]|nr:hypothetical protein BC834DRAFT_842325 [Gloeopeniophorella convolvens]
MPRPVLIDLPLDRFLQPPSPSTNTLLPPPTGSKRPRSPSLARAVFSPAKRRILEQEGLFISSLSRSVSPSSTSSSRSTHPPLFHAPDSHKRAAGPPSGKPGAPPSAHSATRSGALAPPREPTRTSPRLAAASAPKPASPASPTTPKPTRTSPRKAAAIAQTATPMQRRTRRSPSPPLTLVPRELPSASDRRSAHYPGFDVHLDKHLALPTTRSRARAKEEAERAQEGDAAKENVRPPVAAGASSSPSFKSKAKDEAALRRSARLRGSSAGSSPSKKAGVPEARGRERRRSVMHGSSLQF